MVKIRRLIASLFCDTDDNAFVRNQDAGSVFHIDTIWPDKSGGRARRCQRRERLRGHFSGENALRRRHPGLFDVRCVLQPPIINVTFRGVSGGSIVGI